MAAKVYNKVAIVGAYHNPGTDAWEIVLKPYYPGITVIAVGQADGYTVHFFRLIWSPTSPITAGTGFILEEIDPETLPQIEIISSIAIGGVIHE